MHREAPRALSGFRKLLFPILVTFTLGFEGAGNPARALSPIPVLEPSITAQAPAATAEQPPGGSETAEPAPPGPVEVSPSRAELVEKRRLLEAERNRREELQKRLEAVEAAEVTMKARMRAEETKAAESADPVGEFLSFLRDVQTTLADVFPPDHPELLRLAREIDDLEAASASHAEALETSKRLELFQGQMQELSERYSPEHPAVRRKAAEVAVMEERLQTLRRESAPVIPLYAEPDVAKHQRKDWQAGLRALEQERLHLEEELERIGVLEQEVAELEAAAKEEKEPEEEAEFPYIPGVPETPTPPGTRVEREPELLTPEGTLVISPSFRYSRWSEEQIEIEGYVPPLAIEADISDVDRDVFVAALTLRYGLTDRLELETTVPYVWRQDDVTARPPGDPPVGKNSEDVSGSGLGDVEAGVHYQINRGGDGWPSFIGGLRVKTPTGEDQFDIDTDPDSGLLEDAPTGSGFWGLQPRLLAVYRTKRASWRGSLGYTWYIEDDVGGGVGDVDPGDVIDLSLNAILHLFEKFPFGVGYQHMIVGKTEQDGDVVSGSDNLQIGIAKVGAFYEFHERVGCRLTVGVGLTGDAPDVEVLLEVPVSVPVLP